MRISIAAAIENEESFRYLFMQSRADSPKHSKLAAWRRGASSFRSTVAAEGFAVFWIGIYVYVLKDNWEPTNLRQIHEIDNSICVCLYIGTYLYASRIVMQYFITIKLRIQIKSLEKM